MSGLESRELVLGCFCWSIIEVTVALVGEKRGGGQSGI